ncbi:MAG: hypothetical protein M1830_008308 [Pleopsidium flavum]|nr:MAG: hypothetical protein M1830_008308 [Pleopsidium flavum]
MTDSQWNGRPLSLKVIGTNAGTSMDGLDITHIHFTQEHPEAPLHMKLLHEGEIPFDGPLKKRVMHLIQHSETTPEEIAIINIQLGEFAADTITGFAKEQGFSLLNDVDIIAGQGQTIWHLPLPEMFEAKTGITTLSQFRVSDMALGRQGCPLFVAWDGLCASHPTLNRAVQNIGGIANITICPKGDITGGYDFDTGPGNVFNDAAVRYFTNGERKYDKDGAMGAAGKVNQHIVDEILAGPYFSPKSSLDEIYLGGGGSYNPNIINYLHAQLPNTRIAFLDELGIPAGSREAIDFGFKGLECIVGRSLIVPKYVESDRAGIIGQIQPRSATHYHRLLQHLQRFWGDYPLEKRMNPVLKMVIVPRGETNRNVAKSNGVAPVNGEAPTNGDAHSNGIKA